VWQAYQDRGVVVAGIHIWSQKDAAEEARAFAQKHRLTFPILVDSQNSLVATYGVQAVPTDVVIGKDGKVRFIHPGAGEQAVRQAIEEALKAERRLE
jgi:peroxiredoxin